MNFVPGTIVRCYHFKPIKNHEFFLEGIVDGFYYDASGNKFLSIEVFFDNISENFSDTQLVPLDLKEDDWNGRIVEIGFDKFSVDDI